MKTFKQYLTESNKSWKFKIKTIHELTDEQCDRIEKHLTKYDSTGLGAVKKTILQSAPRDFPNHKGYEVFTYEFETERVASGWQIQNDIRNMLGVSHTGFKVKGEHEPDEEIPAGKQEEYKVKLADEKYSEQEKVNHKDHYGEDHKSKFIDELLKLRKKDKKEKGNE